MIISRSGDRSRGKRRCRSWAWEVLLTTSSTSACGVVAKLTCEPPVQPQVVKSRVAKRGRRRRTVRRVTRRTRAIATAVGRRWTPSPDAGRSCACVEYQSDCWSVGRPSAEVAGKAVYVTAARDKLWRHLAHDGWLERYPSPVQHLQVTAHRSPAVSARGQSAAGVKQHTLQHIQRRRELVWRRRGGTAAGPGPGRS